MNKNLARLINDWHVSNGGHFGQPRGHALRLLCEVVELCIASGATPLNIMDAIRSEMAKATDKQEWDPEYDAKAVSEEWADCAILLEVFRNLADINGNGAVFDKHKVLVEREWAVDADGVLWRPGKEPGHAQG